MPTSVHSGHTRRCVIFCAVPAYACFYTVPLIRHAAVSSSPHTLSRYYSTHPDIPGLFRPSAFLFQPSYSPLHTYRDMTTICSQNAKRDKCVEVFRNVFCTTRNNFFLYRVSWRFARKSGFYAKRQRNIVFTQYVYNARKKNVRNTISV